MDTARIVMTPNYTKKNGYWDNIAVRKDERFVVELVWGENGTGTLVFRDEKANIISQVPVIVERMVGSNNNIIFEPKKMDWVDR